MEMPGRLESAPIFSVKPVKAPDWVWRDDHQGATVFENPSAFVNQATRVMDVLYYMIHDNRVEGFSGEVLLLHPALINGPSL